MAYLEMAREVATISTGKPVTQIRNVSWISPIAVNGEQVSITLQQSGDVLAYEVSTQKNGTEQPHGKGFISTDPLPPQPGIGLNALHNRLVLHKSKTACYQLFNTIGQDYGPGFQRLEAFYYNNKEEALSEIALPHSGAFMFHPGMLDSVWQTCMGLMQAKGMATLAVPFTFSGVNIYGSLPAQAWCYTRKHNHPL